MASANPQVHEQGDPSPRRTARLTLRELQAFPHLINLARQVQSGEMPISAVSPQTMLAICCAYEHLVQCLVQANAELQDVVTLEAGIAELGRRAH